MFNAIRIKSISKIIKKYKECLIIMTFFLILLLLYFINIKIPCIFHEITGLYCPGCGITRMLISFIKFRFIEAFNYNELCFIYLILAIAYYIYYFISKLLKKVPKKINNKTWIFLVIITCFYGIIRNIPMFSNLTP